MKALSICRLYLCFLSYYVIPNFSFYYCEKKRKTILGFKHGAPFRKKLIAYLSTKIFFCGIILFCRHEILFLCNTNFYCLR